MNVKKLMLKEIGNTCKRHREKIGATQLEVANDLKVSFQYVSLFEQGKADSMFFLIWYMKHGLILRDLIRILEDYDRI